MADSRIRIMSVDDHPLLRGGIAALISNQSDLHLVAEADCAAEAVLKFRSERPDITLMDIQMPGMGGIEAMQAIRSEFPDARIIVLTTFSGDVLARRALAAGAWAYVLKSTVRKELLDIVRAVHNGTRRIQSEVAVDMANRLGSTSLTTREIAVLQLVAAGNSNKHIGRLLAIHEIR